MSIKLMYHMEVAETKLSRETINFVQVWHYSKSARSQMQKHVFHLKDVSGNLVGVAIYGRPMSRHYSTDTLELRRLCLIDDTPKNTESFFIAKTLKWLEKNTDYVRVVSFADPNNGHEGVIYKASNWEYDGLEITGNPRALLYHGRKVHTRQVYQKRDGKYTSDAIKYQLAWRSGEAEMLDLMNKHRYIYYFRG